jgi:prepilin-type N-terminal cleavage/methylation domain-containing protein
MLRQARVNGESERPTGGRASTRQYLRDHTLVSTQPPTAVNEFLAKKETCRSGGRDRRYCVRTQKKSHGFSLPELLVVLLILSVLTAIAIPLLNGAMASMRMTSTVSAITAGISETRHRAIMNSQMYTFVLTTPNNIYTVTNVATNTADQPVPLPSQAVAINGGANAAYTFTLCPNGTVYGAGGCPSNNGPSALTATYQGRQTNINVSSVGNVTATMVH